ILDPDNYRLPMLSQSKTYQLYGIIRRVKFEDFTNDFVPAMLTEIPYNSQGAPRQKRLIAASRLLYRDDDLSRVLPLNTVEPMGIVSEKYELVFTPELLNAVYVRDGNKLVTDV